MKNKNLKRNIIPVRMSNQERKLLEKASLKKKIKLSTFVRTSAIDEAEKIIPKK